MKRKMYKALSAVIAAAFMLQSFSFAAEKAGNTRNTVAPINERAEDAVNNTPEENIFRIEGSSKDLILLGEDENGYYILSKGVYGARAFDPDGTQRFDPSDSNNIAYWLNNDLIDPEGELGFPKEVIPYLVECDYETEAGFITGICPNDYAVKAKVALLSQTEFIKYQGRFGVHDGIDLWGWWLRTPFGKNGLPSQAMWVSTYEPSFGRTNAQDVTAKTTGRVRPAFHLSEDFFKNVRLDMSSIGKNVLREVFENIEFSQFGECYTAEELTKLEAKNAPIKVNMPQIPEAKKILSGLNCDNEGTVSLSADIKNNPAFESGEWEIASGCKTENGTVTMKSGAYLASGVYLNPKKGYEISLDMSLGSKAEKKAVSLKMLTFDKEKNAAQKFEDIIVLGGSREMKNYRIPITNRGENIENALFVLTAEGSSEITVKNFGICEVEENISFESDWAPYYLITPDNQSFDIKINIGSSANRYYRAKYRLEYYQDGEVIEGQQERKEIISGKENTITVKLPKLRLGGGVLTVYVLDGERTAKEYSREITVYKPYTRHYFDKYSLMFSNAALREFMEYGDEMQQLARNLGVNGVRHGNEWSFLESAKGIYNWSTIDKHREIIKKNGYRSYNLAAYNNPIYGNNTGTGNKQSLDTPEEIKAFNEYSVKTLRRAEENEIEFWNEPNGKGYWSSASPYEYASGAKALSAALRLDRGDDVTLMAGSIDVSKDPINYSNKMFDYGVYPYIQSFSVHPYYHPNTNDEAFVQKTQGYIDIVMNNGGWKDVELTEIGWRTTEDEALTPQQAEEIVKVLVRCEELGVRPSLYCWRERNNASDAVFGMFRFDYSARPVTSSVANYHNFTGGSEYISRLLTSGNSNAFIYLRDGKATVVAWDIDENETLEFNKAYPAYDLFGNSLGYEKSVKLTNAPVYITGMDTDWIKSEFKKLIQEKYGEFVDKYKEALNSETIAEIEKLKNNLSCEKHYELGAKIIGEESEFSKETTAMMFGFHQIGIMLAKFDSIGETKAETISGKFSNVRKRFNERTNNAINGLNFTSEIIRNAKKFEAEYNDLLKEGGATVDKAFFANYRKRIIEGLALWAEQTVDREKISYLGITMCIEPAEVKAYDMRGAEADVSLINYTGEKRKGTLEVFNTEGEKVASYSDISVKNKDFTRVSVKFNTTEKQLNKQMMYTLRYTCGDEVYENLMPVTKLPLVEVTMKPMTKGVEKITSIDYTVKNITEETVDMKFALSLPEGWQAGAEQIQTLLGGETKEISLPVSKTIGTEYNYYPIGLKITSGENTLYNETELLNFTVIEKTSKKINVEAFDGDISEWRDAYPYYIGLPEDFESKESWQDSETAARVFIRYDEENMYFLVDVYDETQMNGMKDSQIWNGDCVQIAIDAGNSKSTNGYDGDDYEFAAALTDFGKMLWCHADGERKDTTKRSDDWLSVIRSNKDCNTRYVVKLPISEMPPMNASEGKFFGMDIAVADSDLLAVRESAISICGTITTAKRPDLFIPWYFIGESKCDFAKSEKTSSVFNEKMSK